MQHIWSISNFRNTHTCERGAIEIDERENLQDILINTPSFFTWKNLQERKHVLRRFVMGKSDIINYSPEIPCIAFFNFIIQGMFISVAMQTPHIILKLCIET